MKGLALMLSIFILGLKEGRKEFMKGFLSYFTVSHMKLLKRLLLLLFKGMEWAYSILFL